MYVFLDESGNLDFSPNGTRYFVLTSVSMERPFHVNDALDEYKYDCIERGIDIEYFHCYEDGKAVRNEVFDLIAAHLDGLQIDCLVVEKARIAPAMRDALRFYPATLGHLLDVVLRRELKPGGVEEVIIITDTIPIRKKRRAMEKAVRATLSRMLPRVSYRVLHHQSRSHYGLQIADYCCWAIFRMWQKGEGAWYDRIRQAVRNEVTFLDIGKGIDFAR